MLDFEENDSCGVIVEQNKLWLYVLQLFYFLLE